MKSLGPQQVTARGFPYIEFKDAYDKPCSLQISSLYGLKHIWLGLDDPSPQVLASQAAQVGVTTDETTGWVPFPVPEQVSINTRMHLGPEQITALIRHLQTFLKTGEFQLKKEDAGD